MAYGNRIDWVKFCLAHGADPNRNLVEDGLTALACTAGTGNIELVNLLLEHGARLKKISAIPEAAIEGDLEMVKHLSSKGADNDEIGTEDLAGDEGYDDMGSPLHHAAKLGNTEMARILIDAGANIHLKDLKGRSPEDLARKNNHTEILDALRRKKGE